MLSEDLEDLMKERVEKPAEEIKKEKEREYHLLRKYEAHKK